MVRPGLVIALLWGVWILSWWGAAFWSAATVRRAGLGVELSYRLILLLGAVLLFVPTGDVSATLRLWRVGWTGAWLCAGVEALGFCLCWWARLYLGRLWSGSITRKADHHIVDQGPYALVRHPIYTGLLLAIGASVVAEGTLPGLAGGIAMALGIWLKARLEERFLRAELGPAAYDLYARRVPMLVPFWRF